ncbi:MAG: hypothetical protein QHJ34_07145 [bacterium]|nr:hypothetical protein [candidate division KSB1 bacterium]MDH7559995.1 hypothetical protein [bacterium]
MKNMRTWLVWTLPVTLALACEEKIPEGPPRGEVLKAHLHTTFGQTAFPQPPDFEDRYKMDKVPPEEMALFRQWQVFFRIAVENVFDETIDGTKWIKVTLRIWPRDGGGWSKTLTYADTTGNESLVIHPGHTTVLFTENKLIWDQTDDQGKSIHRYEPYQLTIVLSRMVDRIVYDPETREKKIVPWIYCRTLRTVTLDSLVAFDPPVVVRAKASVQLFREYPPIESNEFELTIFYLFPHGMTPKYSCAEGPASAGG